MFGRKRLKASKARPVLVTASYIKKTNLVMYMQHVQGEGTLKIGEEKKEGEKMERKKKDT